MIRTFVTFETSFQDDPQFDQAGEMQVPGGREVAKEIVAALRAKGGRATDPEQHSWYGWHFAVTNEAGSFKFILQCPDIWLLIVSRETSFLERFSSREAVSGLPEILEQVAEVLRTSVRFRSPAWFSREEYERNQQSGSTSP